MLKEFVIAIEALVGAKSSDARVDARSSCLTRLKLADDVHTPINSCVFEDYIIPVG